MTLEEIKSKLGTQYSISDNSEYSEGAKNVFILIPKNEMSANDDYREIVKDLIEKLDLNLVLIQFMEPNGSHEGTNLINGIVDTCSSLDVACSGYESEGFGDRADAADDDLMDGAKMRRAYAQNRAINYVKRIKAAINGNKSKNTLMFSHDTSGTMPSESTDEFIFMELKEKPWFSKALNVIRIKQN